MTDLLTIYQKTDRKFLVNKNLGRVQLFTGLQGYGIIITYLPNGDTLIYSLERGIKW